MGALMLVALGAHVLPEQVGKSLTGTPCGDEAAAPAFRWVWFPAPATTLGGPSRPVSHHSRKEGMKLRTCEKGCAKFYVVLTF